MSRAEDAVMRLYEDAALRGELTDEPANRLLKWAEDQLIALDESGVDDAEFSARLESILASVKQINTTVGHTLAEGGTVPDADAQAFGAQAAVSADQVKALAGDDEMKLVENLIALVSGTAPDANAQADSVVNDTDASKPPQREKYANFLNAWADQLLSQDDAPVEDIEDEPKGEDE